MAEEESKRSKGSSFLKKSKWGKILKEKEPDSSGPGGTATRQSTFTLNDDVVDFLKPSTEKNMPKLDIAIAKRWPDAHEVRRGEDASPFASQPTFTKPKRRKGLNVSFVKTLPEIIGEGGDEAPDPPREISRNKAMVQRSISDRKPGSQDFGRPGPRSPPIPLPQTRAMPTQVKEEDDFVPKPIRRAQTSHDEVSAPLQRKYGSPPSAEVEPHKTSLGRTPTGLSAFKTDHFTHVSPVDDSPIDQMPARAQNNGQPRLRNVPTIDTHVDQGKLDPYSWSSSNYSSGVQKDYGGLSPVATISPVQQKRREMSASEGMALRRASMLIQQDDEDDSPPQTRHERSPAQDPRSAASSTRTTDDGAYFSPSNSTGMPGTAVTPDAPNPFADPKYINKRHSREQNPHIAPDVQDQAQSLRQTTRQQAYARDSDPYTQEKGPQAHEKPQGASLGGLIQASTDRRVPHTAAPNFSHHRTPSREDQDDRRVPLVTNFSHHRTPSHENQFVRAIQPPDSDMVPSRAAPMPGQASLQNMAVPTDLSRDPSHSSDMRERMLHAQTAQNRSYPMYLRPNGSSTSMSQQPPSPSHSRSSSRDNLSPQTLHPTGSGHQQSLSPQSPRYNNNQFYHQKEQGSKSSLLSPNRMGPSPTALSPASRGGPNDYFSGSRQALGQPARSPLGQVQKDETERPGSSGSSQSVTRASASPQPPEQSNPATDAAYEEFAARVAHMRGVFRLTAEKEQPTDRCTPSMWLRAGLWWYLRGKSGLEVLLQRRDPSGASREMLHQAHVDLAKSWWILSDPLAPYDGATLPGDSSFNLHEGATSLCRHLKALSLSMEKNKVLPPTQSLIQGQDTRIWLEYPRFTSDAAAVLGGDLRNSILVNDRRQAIDPYALLPLGDTRATFCYGRFPVEVYLNTDEAETDRVVLPCMLTVLRGRRDYQTSIVIASQTELISLTVSPKQDDKRSLTWSDLSWKASSFGITLRLARGYDLAVRMQERDFRAVWNLSEYARKVERSLQAESDEHLIHEARLAELQYADSSASGAFPADKLRGCSALIFERTVSHRDGSGTRKMHRGYRMLLITDSGHKTLSSVSHDVCRGTPLLFEYLTDSSAHGTTAMVVRIREQSMQCRILLVFPDSVSRQALYDALNGLTVGEDETIVGKMALTGLNIEPVSQSQSLALSAHPALQTLQWQRLGVTNNISEDPNSRIPDTVESECLRVVARHSTGCITDRMNLGKGELRLRVPAVDKPLVQILRQPQEDLTMSIDTRNSQPQVSDGIGQLLHMASQQPTVRTFTFASMSDLHAFETAITGHSVRFDGIASTLSIARRRMVVPIYKKWEASNVRLQLVAKDSVIQVLAFMDDFSHADALCFQVKSTDTFETIKGDGKNKKWGVKMVDAKFSLPSQEKGEQSEEEKLQKRFVNLEGLDYAEEHDDITVGFDTEQERDSFAQALPAATSVSRGITLKRRI